MSIVYNKFGRAVSLSKESSKPSFTVKFKKEGHWFVGIVAEVPGVISQGRTKEELFENLASALEDMIRLNLEETARASRGFRQEARLVL